MRAVVKGNDVTLERVAAYMPSNFAVVGEYTDQITGRNAVVIEGTDNAGWTFTGYVQPRLASGCMFAAEVIEGQES